MKTTKRTLLGTLALAIVLPFTNCGTREAKKEEAPKVIKVGEVLHTKYFDVKITNAGTTEHLDTGNQFSDKDADQGQVFCIMECSFTNTDSESRVLSDGKLILVKDGKEYLLEKSETIMLKGWGVMLSNINPLSTLTTNIVYQIPADFKGKVLYEPNRGDEQRIFLGDVDLTAK